MPNWVDCDLTISGTKNDVEAIIAKLASADGTKLIDFNNIIPYPEEFKRADDILQAWFDKPEEGRKQTPQPKDGYNNGGYQWRIENWGTKWNASNICDVWD
jgi:hypothetical protein